MISPQDHFSSLGFVTFLRERDEASLALPLKGAGNGAQKIAAIEQYSLEKIQMNGTIISTLPDDFSVDPLCTEFC